jgi:LPPG:FO 2-phospho-L-lactate transferase
MKIVALAGGGGGAKLVYGFAQILKPGDLTVIVNTGDDFNHYGLYICPDLDSICYSLANIANPLTGWGKECDSFQSLNEAIKLGGPDWFKIGDKDLGTHLERTRRLIVGQKLSEITRVLCHIWGIDSIVFPMTDDQVSTILNTVEMGELPFQEYFVHQKCQPIIKSIKYSGVENAKPVPSILNAIEVADLVVICPSNPLVSIDPILNVQGIKNAISRKKVIVVSPIIQGKALKGPAAKMFFELGIEPSAEVVVDHYCGLVKGFVFDQLDYKIKIKIDHKGIINYSTNTIMHNKIDKVQLAEEIIKFSEMI